MVRHDLPARGLAFAVRALAADRRDWALAMQAELAAVDGASARREFAFGCLRTLLTRPGTLLHLGGMALAPAAGLVSIVLAMRIANAGVRAEALALIALLAATLWLGRRAGPLGPVAADRTSRRVRGASLVVAGVRAHPGANLAIAAATVVGGVLLADRRRLGVQAAIVAGLGAGAATCLVITLLALGTYAARPDLQPDRCGTSTMCGLTPAARAETNAILAGDPYVADLLLGSLLAVLLIAIAGAGLAVADEPGRRT